MTNQAALIKQRDSEAIILIKAQRIKMQEYQ